MVLWEIVPEVVTVLKFPNLATNPDVVRVTNARWIDDACSLTAKLGAAVLKGPQQLLRLVGCKLKSWKVNSRAVGARILICSYSSWLTVSLTKAMTETTEPVSSLCDHTQNMGSPLLQLLDFFFLSNLLGGAARYSASNDWWECQHRRWNLCCSK